MVLFRLASVWLRNWVFNTDNGIHLYYHHITAGRKSKQRLLLWTGTVCGDDHHPLKKARLSQCHGVMDCVEHRQWINGKCLLGRHSTHTIPRSGHLMANVVVYINLLPQQGYWIWSWIYGWISITHEKSLKVVILMSKNKGTCARGFICPTWVSLSHCFCEKFVK